MGYLLASEGGWMAKAGYADDDVKDFLSDLAALAAPLGLTAVGLDPAAGAWHDLPTLRGLADHAPGRKALGRIHLRVYGPADYVEAWNTRFGWRAACPGVTIADDPTAAVAKAMADAGLSGRAVAVGIGEDPSLFAKILNGKKRWPPGWPERALAWINGEAQRNSAAPPPCSPAASPSHAQTDTLQVALEYRARGWSVVPVRAAAKRPRVRWKEFQARLPSEDELAGWFRRWPDAGLALVLGPVSNVFAIDVDGPDARAALLARLGAEPAAPKTLSGSRGPSRYHLLFADPGVATRAKATPWHPKLEFRGRGGLVVLPPTILRGEVGQGPPVVAVYSVVVAAEPVVAVLRLEDVHHALSQFRDDLALHWLLLTGGAGGEK